MFQHLKRLTLFLIIGFYCANNAMEELEKITSKQAMELLIKAPPAKIVSTIINNYKELYKEALTDVTSYPAFDYDINKKFGKRLAELSEMVKESLPKIGSNLYGVILNTIQDVKNTFNENLLKILLKEFNKNLVNKAKLVVPQKNESVDVYQKRMATVKQSVLNAEKGTYNLINTIKKANYTISDKTLSDITTAALNIIKAFDAISTSLYAATNNLHNRKNPLAFATLEYLQFFNTSAHRFIRALEDNTIIDTSSDNYNTIKEILDSMKENATELTNAIKVSQENIKKIFEEVRTLRDQRLFNQAYTKLETIKPLLSEDQQKTYDTLKNQIFVEQATVLVNTFNKIEMHEFPTLLTMLDDLKNFLLNPRYAFNSKEFKSLLAQQPKSLQTTINVLRKVITDGFKKIIQQAVIDQSSIVVHKMGGYPEQFKRETVLDISKAVNKIIEIKNILSDINLFDAARIQEINRDLEMAKRSVDALYLQYQ